MNVRERVLIDIAEARQQLEEEQKLYFFKGRNTGVVASSAEQARKNKKRGSDELDTVRSMSAADKKKAAKGDWVSTRKDGKSPSQSAYGHGRGEGPPRKKKVA